MYLLPPGFDRDSVDERREYISRNFRDPLHYSTLQRGLNYFESGGGFIAFKAALGHKLALTPAVSLSSSPNEAMKAFIEKYKRVILCNLDEQSAYEVSNLNLHFQFAPMGSEHIVSIKNFLHEESTARHRLINGALKHASKHNFHIEEFNPKMESPANIFKMQTISNAYVRRSKIGTEMSFINRPLDIYRMDLARYFKLYNRGGLFGIAVIDPYSLESDQQGYLLNILRFSPTRQWGVYISVVNALCKLLSKEGVKELSLGVAPLDSKDIPENLPQSRSMRVLINKLYTKRYHLFLSQSLEKIKNDISDNKKPRYLAVRTYCLQIGLAALMKSMDVSITKTILKSML